MSVARTVSEANHLHGSLWPCLKCGSRESMFDSVFYVMYCLACGDFIDLEALSSGGDHGP